MITFYSGTPGSGKSFHMAKEMRFKLRLGRNVISTVNIDVNKVNNNGRKKIGDFVYVPILELQPKFLYHYAFKNHVKGKEGQTLIVIDECQIIFNTRDYQQRNRLDWILFFTKHRHLGYNIIMTSQFDRMVDRQIRALFEYEVKHRKINNYGLLFFLPFTAFAAIEYWYGNKLVISRRFLLFSKKVAGIYDSYVMFDEFAREMAGIEDNQVPPAPAPTPLPEVQLHTMSDNPGSACPHAPPTEPDNTTNCVITTSEPAPPPVGAVDAQTGGRGAPLERPPPKARGHWWSRALHAAPLKDYHRKKAS